MHSVKQRRTVGKIKRDMDGFESNDGLKPLRDDEIK